MPVYIGAIACLNFYLKPEYSGCFLTLIKYSLLKSEVRIAKCIIIEIKQDVVCFNRYVMFPCGIGKFSLLMHVHVLDVGTKDAFFTNAIDG